MGKLTISMLILHSCVKLPEGSDFYNFYGVFYTFYGDFHRVLFISDLICDFYDSYSAE